ncbi:hypothetical protein D7V86_20160 [bacterium D16-51]|nr:hypothetical protein D7V96_20450 [bacterium D16-59]RKI56196.1 hypothetical protein D7V86_20160 [bacterium D16-51]
MQGVIVDLPDTSLGALDLENYTVFKEGYCDFFPGQAWDDTFLQKAQSLGGNTYKINIGGTETETKTTITEYQYQMKTEMQEINTRIPITKYNKYGESYTEYIPGKQLVQIRVIDGSVPPTVITRDVTKKEYVGGVDITFRAYKPDTLLRLDRALANLSQCCSQLGAKYNQLEHEYLNDLNASENLQGSESKIRDADIAEEMMLFTKDNILEQAGISMLAQANSSREGVLQLLH